MTNLTQAQTKAMKTLKSFFNPKYASETLCHVSDVAISEITRNRLADEGFITIELGFISFTAKGKEVMGLTVAEVIIEPTAAEPGMTTEQAAVLEEVAILYYNEKTGEPVIQTREGHNEGRSQVKISRELAEGLRDLGYLGSHFHSFWLTAKGCEWAGDYWKAYRAMKASEQVISEVEVEMASPGGKKFVASAKVEGDSYVVKTSMREVKFSKKTMKATGKFAGWRLALIEPKVEATQPPTVRAQRVNPDLFEAYQKAAVEFEAANEVYHKAEAEWLKTGKWPDDKRDAGKVRESALDAKKVASNNYYNLN